MDENASRAVFLGVSVFVAIITLTVILAFYRTAKDSAAVANRYDITSTGNKRADAILGKTVITGLEVRYLLNYYYNDDSVAIMVYQPGATADDMVLVNIPQDDYWSDDTQRALDKIIRPNFNYRLAIDTRAGAYIIVATFEN